MRIRHTVLITAARASGGRTRTHARAHRSPGTTTDYPSVPHSSSSSSNNSLRVRRPSIGSSISGSGIGSLQPAGPASREHRIDKVLGGCALHESWRGGTGHRGSSYNFYDDASGKWHQTWIDVAGAPLYINGSFETGG